jgi:hypothetical protein
MAIKFAVLALAWTLLSFGSRPAAAKQPSEDNVTSLRHFAHGDLSASEQKLIDAARRGKVADYRTGNEAEDNPATGETWGPDRTIRAEIIYTLAVGTNPNWRVHPRGLWVIGAKIAGNLDFTGARIQRPFRIERCYLESPLILLFASAPVIGLNGSFLSTPKTQVSPRLNVWGYPRQTKGQWALIGDNLRVDQSIFLGNSWLPTNKKATPFRAMGEVRLHEARIDGNLDCTGGIFDNPGGRALDLAGCGKTGIRGDFPLAN